MGQRSSALPEWLLAITERVLGVLAGPARLLLGLLPARFRTLFFGSDIYERYTAEYTWIANQVGHAAIGFFFATLVFMAAALLAGRSPPLTAALIILVLWLVYVIKEAADNVMFNRIRGNSAFAGDRNEVVADSFTDVYFVTFGVLLGYFLSWTAFAAASDADPPFWTFLVVLVLGSVFTWRLAAVYMPAKRHFDASGLPTYYRLELFEGDFDGRADDGAVLARSDTAASLLAFARREPLLAHVLVIGARGTGKTSLTVGLGVALTLEHGRIRYVSAAGLREDLDRELKTGAAPDRLFWPFAEVDHLLVDDVPEPAPDAFFDDLSEPVRHALRGKRSVWALPEDADPAAWRAAIDQRITNGPVLIVRLTMVLADRSPRPLDRLS